MANLSSKIQGVSQAAMPVISVPTLTAVFTNATGMTVTDALTYQREGEYLVMGGYLQFTGDGSSASSLYFTWSGITTLASQSGVVRAEEATTAYAKTYLAYAANGGITFYTQNNASVASVNLNGNNFGSVTSGRIRTLYFNAVKIRIQEWVGQGTIQTASTHQVEYAYNSNTATGGDTTSFAYGASGGLVPNITQAVTNSTVAYRVRFRQEIQPSDTVVLEFQSSGSGPWQEVGQRANGVQPFNYNNGKYTGAFVVVANSTDVDVFFGTAGASNTAAYGSATTSDYNVWSSFYSNGTRYRVRKVSGGVLGFGNATTTTPGLVTLAQLTPVTGWTSYTPTVTGVATSTASGKWRRVGDSMEIQGYVVASGTSTTNVYFPLPTGYTAAAGPANIGNTTLALGSGVLYKSSSDYRSTYPYMDTTANIGFVDADEAVGVLDSGDVVSGNVIGFSMTVAINEWAGSLPGLVSDAQVEFVSNSGAEGVAANTAYDSSTYFVTGSDGSQFPSVAADITAPRRTRYRCRFASAILATDLLVLEMYYNGQWSTTGFDVVWGVGAYQNNAWIGAWIEPISGSSTDVYVAFGNGGRQPGATYGAAGTGWSGIAGSSSYKWRVKKVKSSISALVDNASTSQAGLVTTSAQSFAGLKDFTTAGITAPTSALGNVFSGTYTPTVSNVSGFSSITARQAQYIRVGNVVTVSGAFLANVSDTTDCTGTITLPVARSGNFASTGEGLAGTAVGGRGGGAASQLSMTLYGRSGTQLAQFELNSGSIDNNQHAFNYTFTYTIA